MGNAEIHQMRFIVAKAELGTKRVCPETGRKFYDLDKDPIVSPYTQKEYPLTFFEGEPEPEVKEETPKAETESTEIMATMAGGANPSGKWQSQRKMARNGKWKANTKGLAIWQ